MKGYCLLCNEFKSLEKSHAIPRSFFREISTTTPNGLPIHIYPENLASELKGDQYSHHQLCNTCEHYLNVNFDEYCINLLKEKNNTINIIKTQKYEIFSNVDVKRLNTFILSIFWRYYNSRHDYFKNYYIPPTLNSKLRECILGYITPHDINVLVSINKFKADKYLKDNQLKWIIRLPWKSKEGLNLIFGGFKFTLILGKPTYKEFKNKKFNNENSKYLYIHYTSLEKNPDIVRFIQLSKTKQKS